MGQQAVVDFLNAHAATIPRTMLRYAIEHFDRKEREHYLTVKQKV